MKLQHFFSVLSLTGVLNSSNVTIIPFASTLSLFHGSKAEAAVTIRNDYVRIDMPQTGNQDDNWSCGPTSAARLINFYGHNVNRDTLVNAINRDFIIPPSFNVPAPTWTNLLATRRVDIRTGTTPHALRDVMKSWEGENVKLERKADFNKLLGLLRQGKPVLVLLRVDSIDVAGTTWPAMHWVVVNGFSDKEIYFTETTDGKTYAYSYDDFQSMWDWRVGRGLASESLNKNGTEPKTMIWVDRVSPVVASSPTSISLKSLQSFNFPGHFIRHANFFGYISVIDSNLSRNDATWSMVPGLANSQCSSFESKNFPGHYLRHQGLRIKLHQNDNTDLFKADATFCLRNGLADRSSFSFESLNFPNHYIRHRSSELWVDPQANDELYKQDATFRIVNPFVQ